jgi:hypothetical protein
LILKNIVAGVQLDWVDSATVDDSIIIYRTENCPVGERCIRPIPYRIYLSPGTTSYLDGAAASCVSYSYYISSYKIGLGRTSSASVSIVAKPPHTICDIILPIEPVLVDPVVRDPILTLP